ncbi:MAG: ABC transporter permease [Zetaproteobacteria bacterium]|nr:MAG: ABC transporter permease [Zetaproteobacteria bacterium]
MGGQEGAWAETIIRLMAAWLLLAGASAWAWRQRLGLSRSMLLASFRGLVQLMLLAFVLEWIFELRHPIVQWLLIAGFCILAARNSASHHMETGMAWFAASTGLFVSCLVSLPWLELCGAIESQSRTLIPLASMIAANGMNAVSLMFHRMAEGGLAKDGVRAAMIPPVDTLKVVGLVHMPGIFVGMILAGAPALVAAGAQLVILYMIVASSFTACIVTMLMMNRAMKVRVCD